MANGALRLIWKPVAIGFLVLVAIDALFFRTGFYFRYVEPESTAGTIMINMPVFDHDYRTGARNVLVIGDSRIGEGFSPAVANGVGQSQGINFIRIAMPGTTPRVWKYFLSRIDQQSRPLAAVVLMTTSLQDQDADRNLTDRVLDISYMSPLLRLSEAPEFVGSFRDRDARMRALRAAALPALAAQSDLHALLASPLARIEKARLWQNGWAGWVSGYPGRPERLPDVPSGVLAAPALDPDAVPANIAQPLGDYLRDLRTLRAPGDAVEVTGYRRLWYGWIADFYQSRHVPVFVYQMPRGPYHKELVGNQPAGGGLLDLERAHKLTLLDPSPFVDLEQPQYFFDFLHLNSVGRQAFSQRLAELVTPLVP